MKRRTFLASSLFLLASKLNLSIGNGMKPVSRKLSILDFSNNKIHKNNILFVVTSKRLNNIAIAGVDFDDKDSRTYLSFHELQLPEKNYYTSIELEEFFEKINLAIKKCTFIRAINSEGQKPIMLTYQVDKKVYIPRIRFSNHHYKFNVK